MSRSSRVKRETAIRSVHGIWEAGWDAKGSLIVYAKRRQLVTDQKIFQLILAISTTINDPVPTAIT